MSPSPRLQVALPAILTFIFGLAFGIIAGRIIWNRPAPAGGGAPAPPDAMGAMGGQAQAPEHDHEAEAAAELAQMQQMLAAHEALLAKSPDDIGLVRTVGNYKALLGQNEEALVHYAKARELAEGKGDAATVLEIMIDEGISLVEKGDIPGGLRRLEEASAMDAKDVRSRLTRVAVYLERVMTAPPPGMDRKQALLDAEKLLDEIQALEPGNEYAAGFRQTIEGVRGMMGRPRAGAGDPGAAAAASAPAP